MSSISRSRFSGFSSGLTAAARRWLPGSCFALFGVGFLSLQPAIAQNVVLDGSTVGGPIHDSFITEDAGCNNSCTIRSRAGLNALGIDHYLHSFQEFSVASGTTVTFAAPSGIERIFSRVTGSNAAVIEGTLRVDGNADLFLIAPEGVNIFSTGRIISGGSFIASTARSIEFATGSFSTQNNGLPSLLTIGNIPLGLRFVDSNRDVEVQGNATSPPLWQSSSAGTLALLGGNQGTTSLENRPVEVYDGGLAIAAVGPARLPIFTTDTGYAFDFSALNPNNAETVELKNVELRAATAATVGNLEIYGKEVKLKTTTAFISPASSSPISGNITIRAQEFELEDQSYLTTETQSASGGAILIDAAEIELGDSDDDNDIIVRAPSDRLTLSSNPTPTPNFDIARFRRGNEQNDVGFVEIAPLELENEGGTVPDIGGGALGETAVRLSVIELPPPEIPITAPVLAAPLASADEISSLALSEAGFGVSGWLDGARGDAEEVDSPSIVESRGNQPYVIASLCEAQRSSLLLSASGGGGIAAPPSGLAISRSSLSDLGNLDVEATPSRLGGLARPASTPAPPPRAEATNWQTGPRGQIQLVAADTALPVSRLAIRCDA